MKNGREFSAWVNFDPCIFSILGGNFSGNRAEGWANGILEFRKMMKLQRRRSCALAERVVGMT